MSLKNSARESQHSIEEVTPSDPTFRGSGVRARAERASGSPPVSVVGEPGPLLSIGAPADSALLEPTYAYISVYTFACLPPPIAQRLNVAIYELYANALRYGSTSVGPVRFELSRTVRGARLSITNHASVEHRARLEKQMSIVHGNPEAAFSAEMERFAGGSLVPSMLGIVRVAHEAGLVLDCKIEGDRVTISTVCEA